MYTKDRNSAGTDEKITNQANWRIKRVLLYCWRKWIWRAEKPKDGSLTLFQLFSGFFSFWKLHFWVVLLSAISRL